MVQIIPFAHTEDSRERLNSRCRTCEPSYPHCGFRNRVNDPAVHPAPLNTINEFSLRSCSVVVKRKIGEDKVGSAT